MKCFMNTCETITNKQRFMLGNSYGILMRMWPSRFYRFLTTWMSDNRIKRSWVWKGKEVFLINFFWWDFSFPRSGGRWVDLTGYVKNSLYLPGSLASETARDCMQNEKNPSGRNHSCCFSLMCSPPHSSRREHFDAWVWHAWLTGRTLESLAGLVNARACLESKDQ